MLAPTPCAERDCHNYAAPGGKGKCPDHQPKPFANSTRKQRLPKDWSTRRLIVLRRDGGVCHLCGQPGADTVDHVVPGDDHSLENLKAVHDRTPPHCHRYKTSKEGNSARNATRIRQSNGYKQSNKDNT